MTRTNSLTIVAFITFLSALPAQPLDQLEGFKLAKELPRLEVISQGQTGTCWAFATTSFMETELQRIHGKPIDLSELFTVRHTILEKAKNYVAKRGKAPFSEGGLSHDLIAITKNYGAVPQSVYTGLVGNAKSHNHSELFRLLKGTVDSLAKGRRGPKTDRWQQAISSIIDVYLGKAPEKFEVDGKMVTPKEYATDILRIPFDDYLEVMSYSYAPFNERAKLTVTDNWMDYDQYLNLPLEDFMAGFDHALDTGYSVAVDIDVSERTYNHRKGFGKLTDELEKPGAITQEVRDQMFKNKKTTDDHLMHIVGVVKDEAGARWYLTKDSWGKNSGKLKGYRLLSTNYIRAKVLAYIVHKDGLPQP